MREHAGGAELTKIEVEITIDRHELADLDADGDAALVQAVRRFETGRVIVAGDIKPAQPAPGLNRGDRSRAAR
jgi:hypothetical protein